MKRKAGRYPNIEYYEEILRLPGNQLFSPSQIANRKYDKKTHPELNSRMFHALYSFGERNGLKDKPDNCLRDQDGEPIVNNGKHQLIQGQGRAKWFGKTWRNALYDDDIPHFKKQLQIKITKTLANILIQKQHDIALTKEETMSSPVPSRSFPRLKWLLVAMVAVVFTAASFYNYQVLYQGFGVMRTQGPSAALEFFQNRGETFDTLFGKAWAHYRNGNYEEAQELAQRVLTSTNLGDKARASYLLGDLMTIAGEYEKAQEYLLAAHGIYQTTGKSDSEFRALLALSKFYLSQRDLENAEYYLNLAESKPKAESDHSYLYLKSQLAFLNLDFEKALAISFQREQVVKDDHSQLAGIFSDLGFYSCLIGNYDACFSYSMKAQNTAQKLDSEILLMYNNINLFLYQKCTLQDDSYLRDTVLNYARREKDTKIMEYVYFVDKFSCPNPRPDPGHLEPPEDPPPNTQLNRPIISNSQFPNHSPEN